MAKFKSDKDMKQVNLLAFWNSNSDITYDKDGKADGIYVDWQVDQTHLTGADIRAGNYDKNPHLVTKRTENGVDHKIWYALEDMQAVLDLYKNGDDFELGRQYAQDYVMSTGIVADVGVDTVFGHGEMFPMLPKSEEYNPNSMDPDNDRASAYEYNQRHPCHKSSHCDDRGLTDSDVKRRQLKEIPAMVKMVDHGLDRVDRFRDLDSERLHVDFVAHPNVPKHLFGQSNRAVDNYVDDDAKDVAHAIDHMIKRDGRFQSIDYSLFADEQAFKKEASQHDGVLKVNLESGRISMIARDPGRKSLSELCGRRSSDLRDIDFERGMGYEYAWYDSMERQLQNESQAAKNGQEYHVPKVKSNFDFDAARPDGTLEPNSAVKAIRDQKFAKAVPVIAMWSDKDRTHEGWRTTGYYVDVQIDQSKLSSLDIANGKGYSNPSVSCSSHARSDVGMNKVWYSANQIRTMEECGSICDDEHRGTEHYCSFTANIMSRENPKNGNKVSVVLLPKDITDDMSPSDKAAVEKYNRLNDVLPSQHGNHFDMSVVNRQFNVTRRVCELTNFPSQQQVVENEQDKSMDLQTVADMELG